MVLIGCRTTGAENAPASPNDPLSTPQGALREFMTAMMGADPARARIASFGTQRQLEHLEANAALNAAASRLHAAASSRFGDEAALKIFGRVPSRTLDAKSGREIDRALVQVDGDTARVQPQAEAADPKEKDGGETNERMSFRLKKVKQKWLVDLTSLYPERIGDANPFETNAQAETFNKISKLIIAKKFATIDEAVDGLRLAMQQMMEGTTPGKN